MPTFTDKSESTKSQKAANELPSQTDAAFPLFQFADGRAVSASQESMQAVMNSSPSVAQLKVTQEAMQRKPTVASPISSSANHTGLPAQLKSGVEQLSGLAMDDVRVHYNSARPAQFQANAYAQGTDIHLASGQEKHLPHEAWHVVQQKQGRVRPTMQLNGAGVNDDVGLEREADVMGGKAAAVTSGIKESTVQRKLKNSNTEAIQFDGRLSRFVNTISHPHAAYREHRDRKALDASVPFENFGSPPAGRVNTPPGPYPPRPQTVSQRPPAQSAVPAALPYVPGTIDQFLYQMAAYQNYPGQPIQDRGWLDKAKSIGKGALSVGSNLAEAVGIRHENLANIKEIGASVKDAATNILRYVKDYHKDPEFLRGLIREISRPQNLDAIEKGAAAAREILGMTSAIPFLGIAVKALMVCYDCKKIKDTNDHLRAHNNYDGMGSLDAYFQQVAQHELHSHVVSLIKHASKLTLKIASATGIGAIIAKPAEAVIVIGQIAKGVAKTGYQQVQKVRHKEDHQFITHQIMAMASEANATKDPETKEHLRDYLGHLGLDHPRFYSKPANEQKKSILGKIQSL